MYKGLLINLWTSGHGKKARKQSRVHMSYHWIMLSVWQRKKLNAKSDFIQAGKTGCLFSFPSPRVYSIDESRVNVEPGRKITGKRKSKISEKKKKTVARSLFQPHISHGLAWSQDLCCERLATRRPIYNTVTFLGCDIVILFLFIILGAVLLVFVISTDCIQNQSLSSCFYSAILLYWQLSWNIFS